MPDTVDKKWLDDEEAKRYWEMAVEQALFGDESNHPRSFLAMDTLHAAALIESLREKIKRHNDKCEQICAETECCYNKLGKLCPTCPKDWTIDD